MGRIFAFIFMLTITTPAFAVTNLTCPNSVLEAARDVEDDGGSSAVMTGIASAAAKAKACSLTSSTSVVKPKRLWRKAPHKPSGHTWTVFDDMATFTGK